MTSVPWPGFTIAIVDDEQPILDVVSTVLFSVGITNVVGIRDSRLLMKTMEERDIGLVLLDLSMPLLSGEQLIPLLREEHPDVPVVVITGNHDLDTAVECMKAGVEDYLTKPVEPAKLVATVRRFVEIQELRRENAALGQGYLSNAPAHPEAFADIITGEESLRRLFLYTETISATQHVVLITGETGVGKELVAHAIHRLSGRTGEFVAVNVAGLDEAMFSDTLFGHRAGAFPGAGSALPGLIERAAGGTLFLDEIGDLAQGSQVKLLRLLESREYYPLGSDVVRTSQARVIVATNSSMEQDLEAGRFRRDLYYRLKTHHVHVPPLRERRGDIPLLVRAFVVESARELGKEPPLVPSPLMARLVAYPFPGNVRELKSMVFDAVSRHVSGPLTLQSFSTPLPAAGASHGTPGTTDQRGILTIKESVERLVEEAMRSCNGNRTAAARLLGITPQALGQRLKKTRQGG